MSDLKHEAHSSELKSSASEQEYPHFEEVGPASFRITVEAPGKKYIGREGSDFINSNIRRFKDILYENEIVFGVDDEGLITVLGLYGTPMNQKPAKSILVENDVLYVIYPDGQRDRLEKYSYYQDLIRRVRKSEV